VPDKQLFEKLVEKGLLAADQSEKILAEALLSQKRAEEFLYERRLVDEVEIAKIKSALLGIPYRKVSLEQISDELLKAIPEETALNYRVIPYPKMNGCW
jgi:polyhydroxyalkanoate synthesis regulator phasin